MAGLSFMKSRFLQCGDLIVLDGDDPDFVRLVITVRHYRNFDTLPADIALLHEDGSLITTYKELHGVIVSRLSPS